MATLSISGEGAQISSGYRRRRASTFNSPTTPRLNLDRVDSSSDPGHGYYSSSNSSTEPQSVSIEYLRPYQASATSRNEASLSYAGTSSATQSFVSLDSRSGPTDTPHASTHSLHRPTLESDSDGEAEGRVPPELVYLRPLIESGDDTVRQPLPPAQRSSLVHIVHPSDASPNSTQKPFTTDSQNIPVETAGPPEPEAPAQAESVSSEKVEAPTTPAAPVHDVPTTNESLSEPEVPPKAESVQSNNVEPSVNSAPQTRNILATTPDPTEPIAPVKTDSIYSEKARVPVPLASTSQAGTTSNKSTSRSTPSRHTIAGSHRSDAVISPTNHPPLPTDSRKSATYFQRLSAAPVQSPPPPSPPPKAEPDHPAVNGVVSEDPERPLLPPTTSQMDTQYVNMLLALDDIPQIHNIMASFFTWILLAGFVLFPGTFTSLQEANGDGLGSVGAAILGSIAHLPLFVIAWICTGVGAIGMTYLWYRWQANYIWIVNRIFMPGLLNSLAGVLSTLANVLGVHHATFSLTSKSTIIVTTGLTGICGALTVFYTFFMIRNVKKKHDQEVGKQRAGKHGEGFVDVSKRRVAKRLG